MSRNLMKSAAWSLVLALAVPAVAQGPYTYFPSGDISDGKFLIISGKGRQTLANRPILAWCIAPSSVSEFTVGIFDGDTGLDDDGNLNWWAGNWDKGTTPLIYRVYLDPERTGSRTRLLATYHGNAMPNNDWFDVAITCGPEALSPDGSYYGYFLEVQTADINNSDWSCFKLRCDGQVSLLPGEFGVIAVSATPQDDYIIYPNYPDLSVRTYDGGWHFDIYVPETQAVLSVWDGDFDLGDCDGHVVDTDDPDTPPELPDFAVGTDAQPEDARSPGKPPDNHYHAYFRVEPAVWYYVEGPAGTYSNLNPSGNYEWEKFTLSTDPAVPADVYLDAIPAGWYTWQIRGLDLSNLNFIHTDYEIFGQPEYGMIGDFVWNDENRNGIQDNGEAGLAGVRVELLDGSGHVVDHTFTQAEGLYLFSELDPGGYRVRFTLPDGCVFSPKDQGVDDGADSDADPLTGLTECTELMAGEADLSWDAGMYTEGTCCLLIIDEDTIDNDMYTIEQAASRHRVKADWLINDDRPTEYGNPWLRWNEYYPGDIVLLPGGQVDDEGWFALPKTTPWSKRDFYDGVIPQSRLDKIPDVMPLRNQELVKLVGRTCVAIVYDSDISMNYKPINGNLQGARLGKFAFTVLAVELPGSIPESKSDTSLYDLWVRVEPPMEYSGGDCGDWQVTVRDHEPDSIKILEARYSITSKSLTVVAESDYWRSAYMTLSVDGPDRGTDWTVAPSILEAPMQAQRRAKQYRVVYYIPENVRGRRVTISTDKGGAYNSYVR